MARSILKTLIIVAHPDDEILGAGIWMHRHPQDRVHILHTTDGSPQDMHDAHVHGIDSREAYASIRRQEFQQALRILGIPSVEYFQLSFIDKETYLHLPALVVELTRIIKALRPDRVLASAYEGGHPDHDAVALAVALARQRGITFEHLEFPLYHADAHGEIVTGEFVFRSGESAEETLVLTHQERNLKRQMLDCYTTQAEILSRLHQDAEHFRPAPAYDFTKSPHPWPLLYETWGWGISGESWRQQAAEALSMF